ncbi:uncharacterized protein C6orf47 homolog [Fundulus heteroclitus]|uniref:uncharacterized protein C6orf47 homolog n=1 Tax=Fundulus heteroclitus TaxID=8078 RepID=UPI00165C1783|nr:uncharacterized protein C6orf47 homolog [Fundulus heteroclitus]
MAAVVGRAWGWVRSWGRWTPQNPPTLCQQQHVKGEGGVRGWASWMLGGWRKGSDPSTPVEEYWEAQEKLQPMEVEDLGAGKAETDPQVSKWWSKYLPSLYPWPRKTDTSGLRQRKSNGQRGDLWLNDADGDFSDYGTPPPSPNPSQLTSPFRFFASSWNLEIVPEHYEICFNFLRHLFDLFVVAFLWTVSPPVKLILEVSGVQGALRLWFHGMAMFLVSTAGMAGLLWLIQEYLPQFALIYGIVQALVISVSVRQSVILGVEEDKESTKETDEKRDHAEQEENLVSKELLKTTLT